MPRLLAPAVLGLLFFTPCVSGRLLHADAVHGRRIQMQGFAACLIVTFAIFALGWRTSDRRFVHSGEVAQAAPAPASAGDGDWRYYGRTPAGERYASVAQVTPENASKLNIAWKYQTGDTMQKGEDKAGREFLGLHTNHPLLTGIFNIGGNIVTAGGVIFIAIAIAIATATATATATADNYLRAFDERSGKELWKGRLRRVARLCCGREFRFLKVCHLS